MKITLLMFTMVFVAFGTAYAADNSVTDFTGRSYDSFEMQTADAKNSVEGESAGGLRTDDKELYNGVTDFSGRSYESFEIGMAGTNAVNTVEGESAGGLRAGDRELHNGVTDFSGRSYDDLVIGR